MFHGESSYELTDIVIKNTTTNSKFLLNFLYKDTVINHLEGENIKCIGDGGHTSLILFDAGENNNKFVMNNIHLKNCKSDGPFFKIMGQACDVTLNESTIEDCTSYGPLFESVSYHVGI